MRYFSPAKINLFFRVLRKRADGFHEIASLLQAIDLCDILTFKNHPRDLLTCSDSTLPCDESNLVMKALKRFRQHYEVPPVHIHLEKRVPMQAGLGGGSSNAATVLWALNEKIGRRASISELCQIGGQLGSDVPFFFSLGSAYCTGRGEILEPFSFSPISGYLAKPSFGLSTPLVYRETKVSELALIDPIQARDSFLGSHPQYFNDLEPAAFRIEPGLAQFKRKLLASHFSVVCMTGSGTAFFCLSNHQSKTEDFDGAKELEQVSDIHFIRFGSLMRDPFSWYGSCAVR
jgi:4-diphosphocytidyl-2-C-methyl-D-erythritol kinase